MKATVVKDSINGVIRLTTMVIDCPAVLLLDLLPIRELSITRRPPFNGAPKYPGTNIVDLTPYTLHTSCQIVTTSAQWATVLDQIEGVGHPGLAHLIKSALWSSVPDRIGVDEWHLPFIGADDVDAAMVHLVNLFGVKVLLTDTVPDDCVSLLTNVSIARCLNGGDLQPDRVEQIKNDLAMFSQYEGAFATPRRDAYDHQATPDTVSDGSWRNANLHGNLTGWCQYRQIAQWEAWKRRGTGST